jgi:23S rRNA (pseudouridine1915-N3)-methyltransferase
MRLRLVSVGRDRSGLFEPAVQEYVTRLRRQHHTVDLVELREEASPEREADVLLGKVSPQEVLVCLDQRGKELSTEELAERLRRWRDESREVVFAIGGDEGHGEAVRKRADLVWSLSRLVLPHRLVRVIVAEQIYRAFTILRGEPYHK